MSDVTRVLSAIDAGDPRAVEQLLPLVYEELRKLAKVRMANEKPGQTLQATALVHEEWLKIAGDGSEHLFPGMVEACDPALAFRNGGAGMKRFVTVFSGSRSESSRHQEPGTNETSSSAPGKLPVVPVA